MTGATRCTTDANQGRVAPAILQVRRTRRTLDPKTLQRWRTQSTRFTAWRAKNATVAATLRLCDDPTLLHPGVVPRHAWYALGGVRGISL